MTVIFYLCLQIHDFFFKKKSAETKNGVCIICVQGH